MIMVLYKITMEYTKIALPVSGILAGYETIVFGNRTFNSTVAAELF